MKQRNRKTFYNWLTNRYQLIIRNEENFAEKTTFGFNYARVIALGFIFFVLVFIASLYFGKYFLSSWYEPDYIVNEQKKMLADLAAKEDEYEKQALEKDHYIKLVKLMMIGGETFNEVIDTTSNLSNIDLSKFSLDTVFYLDRNIRAEYNQVEVAPEIDEEGYVDLQFDSPVKSPNAIKNFDEDKGKYQLILEGKAQSKVKNIDDGIVLVSGNNKELGNFIIIQHSNNILSKYSGLKSILKKDHTFVKAGEEIAEAGELENGKTKTIFELHINGNPVNPLPYIRL